MLKKSSFYLIAGFILLAIGGMLQTFKGDYFNSQAYYANLVERNLTRELEALEHEMAPVLDSISKVQIIQFRDFDLDKTHPYFVYRNGELKVWSDYSFAPTYAQVAGDYSFRLLTEEGNIYLVRKWFVPTVAGKLEVVSLIMLRKSYSVQNKYLEDQINQNIFHNQQAEIVLQEKANATPINLRNQPLFWITLPAGFQIDSSPFNIGLLVLYSLATVLLLAGYLMWVSAYARDKRKWLLPLAIFLAWMLIKLAFMVFDFPYALAHLSLFDPKFFAVSWFERSFGDMLINTIGILAMTGVVFHKYRIVPEGKQDYPVWQRVAFSGVIIFLLSLILNYQYLQLRAIYFNSQITLDITRSLAFDHFRVLSLLVFILISGSTMLLFHVLIKRLDGITGSWTERLVGILLGGVAFWVVTNFINLPPANLLLVTVFIVVVLLYTGMHLSIQHATNAIPLYIFFWIIIESVIGAWSITEFERARETNKMVRYAQNLAAKHDFMAEFMISEVMEAVKNDPSISARLSNPFLSKDFIISKISRGYLSKYLDKYNLAIYLYSHSGEGIPGFGTTLNYFDIKNRYGMAGNKTEFEGLYILNQDLKTLSRHYMAFLPIKRYDKVIGYIILDFRQKRLIPQNVYPELLVDNRFIEYQSSVYSYAIFEDNYLIQSSGDLNYSFINLARAGNRNPWVENGYLHYLLADVGGDTIIVSVPDHYLRQLISNSAFLLTLLILPVILVLAFFLGITLYRGQPITYTARIQLFLNMAFFIPLALVTITTLSFITSSFKREQISRRIEEANRLAAQIEQETDAYLVDINAKDLLTEKLTELAQYGHFDATVFGTDGLLITTTQPGIFAAGLQSGYLNPRALIKLVENHESGTVENEAIGSLNYYAAYSAIRSPETNRLLGILAIPFFQAERTIEKNQIEALTTILNVFVFIFILALLATFQTSRWLTAPLLLIRQKLGQTSFSSENKPIQWESDDEIGKLISEYNQMLVKLEASKEALARSQKESAWREVAQQVAHEIKNPLTPMKLTLQKLERTVVKGSDAGRGELVTTVKNLLSQLQMLNDIVTSFSEFAKMPIPKNEKINLAEVLRELSTFFDSDEVIDLKLQLHTEKVFILADRKLMSRILSNIIINAGQSRKEGQQTVEVVITTEAVADNTAVQISIADNGSGISQDVVDRVFIPRFSTKKEGSGIGLAVAKHGIEHAGGTIWFETTWGKGTTFFLQLPEAG